MPDVPAEGRLRVEADEEREPVAVIGRVEQLDGMEDQETDRAHSSLLRPKLQCGCLGVLPIGLSAALTGRLAEAIESATVAEVEPCLVSHHTRVCP